ncbi:hypothetical protein [Alkalilacustris brevis]|nr:hypothetical protein [Alkalilacustris brevis]
MISMNWSQMKIAASIRQMRASVAMVVPHFRERSAPERTRDE